MKKAERFPGLSANDCCNECQAERCVISGKNYCGHPYKGGLRHSDMTNMDAIKQMHDAKLVLELQKAKKRVA